MQKTGKNYKFSDLVDVKSFNKGFSELNKQLASLHKSMKSISKIDSKNMSGGDLKKVIAGHKEVEVLKKERIKTTNELSKAQTKAIERRKKEIEFEKKIEKSLSDRRKEAIRSEKKAFTAQQKRVKLLNNARQKTILAIDKERLAEEQLQKTLKKVATTEDELIELSKAQTISLKRSKRGTDEQKKAYDDLEDSLGRNNARLRALGKKRKDDRRNVGNYKDGVIDLDKSVKQLNADMIKGQKTSSKFSRGLSNVGNSLKGFGAVALAGAGIQQITSFLKDSFNAYNTQIEVEKKLEVVLKQRTNATDKQLQSIKNLTSEQQKNGIIGDEIQIAGAQQISTFVTHTDSVETLIPALNNLLAQQKGVNATQSDAVNIANLAGKALQGQTGALTRVGISFSDAQGEILKYGTETERANILAQVITENVGEMNSELAKTDAGKIKNLTNNFGDAQEQIGGTVAKITASLAGLGNTILSSVTNGNVLTDVFKSIAEEFSGLFGVISKVTKLLGFVSDEASIVDTIFKTLSVTFTIATTPLRLLIWLFTKLIEGFLFVHNGFTRGIKVIKDFALSFDFVNIAIDFAIDKFQIFSNAITSLLTNLGILDEQQKKNGKSASELAKQKEIAAYFANQQAIAEQKSTIAIENNKEATDAAIKSTDEYAQALESLRNKSISTNISTDSSILTDPTNINSNDRNNELNSLNDSLKNLSENNRKKIKLSQEYLDAVAAINRKFDLKQAKIDEDLAIKKFKDLQKLDAANFKQEQLILEKTLTEIGLSDKERLEFAKQASLEELDFKILQLQNYLEFVKQNNKDLSEEEKIAMENSILALQVQRIKLDVGTDSEGKEKEPKTIKSLVKGELGGLGFSDEESELIIENSSKVYEHLEESALVAFEAEMIRNEELLQASDDRIKSLKDELKAEEEKNSKGIANNSSRIKAEIALEKKKNDELLAEKKKLAENEKRIAIGKIAISTAIAVVNALLQLPSPKAWIDAAGAAIVGALQIATVSKQKFEKGGTGMFEGADHTQGGITFGNGKYEAQGGEKFGVLSRTATAKHSKLFEYVVNGMNNDNLDFINDSHLILSNDNSDLIKGQEQTNKHLKDLVHRPDRGFDSNGNLKTVINGNKTIHYNH
ncbi:MAG: hypothetical protein IMY67_01865 [Bacteroidetes bacterium]|nr:hypothetical protein [Bacteroidota bacterium]